MPTFTLTKHIQSKPAEVFRVFADLPNAPKRIKGIKRLEVLTEGPIGVGTRFRETRIMFKKEATEEMTVTAFEPGQSYTVGCTSCGCEFTSTIRFLPFGTGTTVEMSFSTRPVSLFAKIMSPLSGLMMGPMMKKCMNDDLEDLKAAIEMGV